ncbi:MAG TPA: hypothetical protein DCM28_05400 [Phycisphaerales bacterium]|nr:hypothetical protein [Phycisphaerales bacterium]
MLMSMKVIRAYVMCLTAICLMGCSTVSVQMVINVKDHGAIGDGKADDYAAFVKALEITKAQGGKPVTIQIPQGTYRLGTFDVDKPSKEGGNLTIENMANVSIVGENQPLLLMGNPYRHGIFVSNSKNITVQNVRIDYSPMSQTQGTIVAVTPDKHFIDVKIAPGYPLPTESWIDFNQAKKIVPTKNVGYIFDAKTGRKLNQFYDQYMWKNVTQDLGNGVYRFTTSNEVEPEMVGNIFTIVSRRKADGVKIDNVAGCLMEKVVIYHAPACGWNVSNSKDVVINNSHIARRPNTDRMMSTNADGLHSKWCANGPVLSNSSFTGMGDDSVNIGGSYTPVIEQPDEYTMIVQAHGTVNHKIGDYKVVDRTTLGHVSLGNIRSIQGVRVDGFNRPCLKLTFENKLPKLITYMSVKDKDRPQYKCSRLINYDYVGRGGKVINCHFYDHRLRGILMRCPDALIKGNHFENLAGPGIVVANDSGFLQEGPSGDGTLIEDNTFTNIERSNIMLYSGAGEQSDIATQGVMNVIIRNNRFESYGGANIYGRGEVGNLLSIRNASNVLIENNTIGKPSDEQYRGQPVILNHTSQLIWKNNRIEGKPLALPTEPTATK